MHTSYVAVLVLLYHFLSFLFEFLESALDLQLC